MFIALIGMGLRLGIPVPVSLNYVFFVVCNLAATYTGCFNLLGQKDKTDFPDPTDSENRDEFLFYLRNCRPSKKIQN